MSTTLTLVHALPPDDNPANDEIVLLTRISEQRYTFTAMQVVDTIASYLATGGTLSQGYADDPDPAAPLHVIAEQWAWGNVTGWLVTVEPIARDEYRHRALDWIGDYFGHFPPVSW